MDSKTLYRPIGPAELEKIKASNWSAFPPRLEGQPIFYPVLNREYAVQIARDWNVAESGSGFVTEFDVDSEYLSQFETQIVGRPNHEELWVPAEQLEEFNNHIVGKIRIIDEFNSSD